MFKTPVDLASELCKLIRIVGEMQLIKDINAMHILEPRCDTHPSLTIHKVASEDGRERSLQSMVSSICRVKINECIKCS